jgi:ATP-binding cassette, subfamily B, multidrug efflux pump
MFQWFENLVNPFPLHEVDTPPKRFWAFAWACTKGMRTYVLGMMLFTGLIGAFEGFLFALIGRVVDKLSHISPQTMWAQNSTQLIWLGLILVGSTLLIAAQTLLKHQSLAGNFPMRLRWDFHRLMLQQSMSFYQDEFAGRVSAKVMQTALAMRDMWFILTDILVYVVTYLGTMVIVAGSFHPWLMVPLVSWLVLYGTSMFYFVPQLSKVSRMQADARSLMTGRITDAYTNIGIVKLFSHAGREAGYAQGAMHEFLGTVHNQMRLVSIIETLNHFLNMLLIVSGGGVALWLWSKGQIGAGGVAAFTAMSLRLNGISHWVMWEMTSLYEQIGTVQDGMNTLAEPHSIHDIPKASQLKVTQGKVDFKQVDFAYANQKNLLHSFDIQITAGEKVGLVGRSGAGKSTIVNLLLRFYDIQSGEILIDNQNIKTVTQNSLRAHIGMVTQDTSLLHRSVRENILYGRPDATEAEMVAAANRAEAHDFILNLRDAKGRTGYDAHVGERGVKLSGGQRQRIAIARVMLKDAPILILDEATSALDSEVEAVIQTSLNELMQGKTVVAIAHRLSTIAAMDRLIVLDHGKIVEEGTHKALLKKKGLYASLWARQSGGFLAED